MAKSCVAKSCVAKSQETQNSCTPHSNKIKPCLSNAPQQHMAASPSNRVTVTSKIKLQVGFCSSPGSHLLASQRQSRPNLLQLCCFSHFSPEIISACLSQRVYLQKPIVELEAQISRAPELDALHICASVAFSLSITAQCQGQFIPLDKNYNFSECNLHALRC